MSLVLALALAAAAAPGGKPGASSAKSGPVVVAPPEVVAPADAYLAEAVADELPRALGELGVAVLERYDRQSVQDRLGLPAVALSRATQVRVAEAVGAFRLVTSTVAAENGQLAVKVRLLDLSRGALAAPLLAHGPVESLPALLAGLAFDIALAGAIAPARSREVVVALRMATPFEAWKAHAEALAAPDPAARAKLLRRALALHPGYSEARVDLARLQLESREHAPALETLQKVAREGGTGRAARFAEGVALLGLGRYQEAAALYADLGRASATTAVLANEGVALLRLKQRGRPASAPLREALEGEPGSRDVPVSLGFALMHENEPAAAAFFLRAAVRRDPRDGAARLLLSWAHKAAGLAAQAEEDWVDLQSLTDAFASLREPDLGRRFERVLPSEWAVVIEPQSAADVNLTASLVLRGEKLLQEGEVEAAVAELLRAVSRDPFAARAHSLLARALRRRGEVARAEEELLASLYCREDTAVRMELADLLQARGRDLEARAQASRVLLAEPNNAAARRLLEDRP